MSADVHRRLPGSIRAFWLGRTLRPAANFHFWRDERVRKINDCHKPPKNEEATTAPLRIGVHPVAQIGSECAQDYAELRSGHPRAEIKKLTEDLVKYS